MKKFRLLKSNDLLSSSLNNSNIYNETENNDKEGAAARGLAIITATKKAKIIKGELCKTAVKKLKVKEPKKVKLRRSKPSGSSQSEISFDLVVPKKTIRSKKVTPQNTDIDLPEIASLKDIENKSDESKENRPSVTNSVTSNNSFKTPKIMLLKQMSLESPIFTSSPLIPIKANNMRVKQDFSSSEIIASSDAAFGSESSKLSVGIALMSPILRETRSASSVGLSQTHSIDKPHKLKSRQSAPVIQINTPTVTRYGRVVRSFAETDRGKVMANLYLQSYK